MALCMVITPIWGHQEKEALAQRPTDASEVADAWMMLTGHTSGVIQLWGNQACEIVPLARLTSQRTACRSAAAPLQGCSGGLAVLLETEGRNTLCSHAWGQEPLQPGYW